MLAHVENTSKHAARGKYQEKFPDTHKHETVTQHLKVGREENLN